MRLPAKSAARFLVVSKLWSSITTRPDFIRSFAFQSSTQLCLLACVKARDKRLFISLPQHELPVDASYSHVDSCQIKTPEHDYGCYYLPCSESVHGLVCFGDSYKIVVWNPSMRQHVTLPEPKLKTRVSYLKRSCLLGHDPVEDKYKVLCISGYHRGHEAFVFTLGPQESWRVAQNSPSHIPLPTMGRLGICIKGHVYYEAEIRFKVDDTFKFEEILMSFDVRYEKFNTIIKKPADPTLANFMLNYQEKLAWVCAGLISSIRFWVLGDGDKQEWSLKNFILPFPSFSQSDPIFECRLKLTGVTHDTGEFIFTATVFEAFLKKKSMVKKKKRLMNDMDVEVS